MPNLPPEGAPIATCQVCGHPLDRKSGVEWNTQEFEYQCFDCYLWYDGVIEQLVVSPPMEEV